MPSDRDYTTWARNITYRLPKLTYVGIQVSFWVIAFVLYATLTYLNNLYLHELGEAVFPLSYQLVALVFVLMGLLFGIILGYSDLWIDHMWTGHLSVGRIIVIKIIFYPIVLALIIALIRFGLSSHINTYFEGIYSDLIESHLTWRYFYGSLLLYTVFMAATISFINQMNTRFGPGILIPLLLGRFKTPKVQQRFFMFLDLKSSTKHAEKLGHLEYSSMIKDCFSDLNNVLTKNYAEIYQYAGDEAVITWPADQGKRKLSCLSLFFDFRDAMNIRKEHYLKSYGFLPEFKAGLHCGIITAVEVGRIKREIAYHGDTINTAARIQAMNNDLNESFLISGSVASLLEDDNNEFYFGSKGDISLKGKDKAVEIFSVNWLNPPSQR
jgi:adenylate cyclase